MEQVRDGFAKLESGLFIQTQENLIFEQKRWDDEDPSKHTDFSTSPFWLTTDGGADPEGYDTVEEIIKEGEKYYGYKKINS